MLPGTHGRPASRRGWHKNVGGLMAVVAFVALGFAALRGATALWACLAIVIALAAHCAAAVGAALRRGDERAPWLGFAAFGWAYFLLCLGPWRGDYGLGPGRFLGFAANALLVRVEPELLEVPVSGREEFAVRAGTGRSRESFQGTFHAVASVLFASAGSLAGRVVVPRRPPARPIGPTGPERPAAVGPP